MKQEHIDHIKNNLRVNTLMAVTIQDESGVLVPAYYGYVPVVVDSMSSWLEHTRGLASAYDCDVALGYPEMTNMYNGNRALIMAFRGEGTGEGADMRITFELDLESLGLDSQDLDNWVDSDYS